MSAKVYSTIVEGGKGHFAKPKTKLLGGGPPLNGEGGVNIYGFFSTKPFQDFAERNICAKFVENW